MSRFTRVARSSVSGQQDVGHEGAITGREAFSFRSSISLISKESPSLHSNQLIYMVYVFLMSFLTIGDEIEMKKEESFDLHLNAIDFEEIKENFYDYLSLEYT